MVVCDFFFFLSVLFSLLWESVCQAPHSTIPEVTPFSSDFGTISSFLGEGDFVWVTISDICISIKTTTPLRELSWSLSSQRPLLPPPDTYHHVSQLYFITI